MKFMIKGLQHDSETIIMFDKPHVSKVFESLHLAIGTKLLTTLIITNIRYENKYSLLQSKPYELL